MDSHGLCTTAWLFSLENGLHDLVWSWRPGGAFHVPCYGRTAIPAQEPLFQVHDYALSPHQSKHWPSIYWKTPWAQWREDKQWQKRMLLLANISLKLQSSANHSMKKVSSEGRGPVAVGHGTISYFLQADDTALKPRSVSTWLHHTCNTPVGVSDVWGDVSEHRVWPPLVRNRLSFCSATVTIAFSISGIRGNWETPDFRAKTIANCSHTIICPDI